MRIAMEQNFCRVLTLLFEEHRSSRIVYFIVYFIRISRHRYTLCRGRSCFVPGNQSKGEERKISRYI